MAMSAANVSPNGNSLKMEAQLSKSVKQASREMGREHPDVAMALLELGDFYRAQSRDIDSESSYRRATEIYEALGDGHQLLQAVAMRSLAQSMLAQGKFGEAMSMNREANELIKIYQ